MVRKRLGRILLIGVAVALTGGPLAGAHPTATSGAVADDGGFDKADGTHVHHQHGGVGGHLEATSENLRLVSKTGINQFLKDGRVADVNVLGDYAYLGAYWEPDCQKGGVYVFDIANPAKPKQVNFIRNGNNSYVSEGVQVVHLDTAAFTGDVLIHNNEVCDKTKRTTVGGIGLVDVSNPKTHKYLANNVGDFSPAGFSGSHVAHTVHSAFAWQHGGRAYVVTVDNEELADVDILDITNPARPRWVAEYDVNRQFPQVVDPTLGTSDSFFHDVVVKEIDGRQVMSVSYWDSGYVLLDVTNPAAATYVGDSDYANPDRHALERGLTVIPEGNAHQSEFTADNRYLIATDEDFDAYSVRGHNLDEGGTFAIDQGTDVPHIDEDTSIEGTTRFVGRACNGDPAVPAAATAQIAVVSRGMCTFTEKLANVEAAGGYLGAIFYNREGGDGCSTAFGMLISGNIPAVSVPRDVGFGLFDATYDENECRSSPADAGELPAAVGATGDRVRLAATFDGWGYVHLYRNGTGKLEELDTYAIREAHEVAFAKGFGDLSVHEVATSERDAGLAYLSYYSGGIRVVRVENDTLVERGRFIEEGGSNFWGVQVWHKDGKEYLLASDRDHGLYIFEYTGP